VVGTTSEITFEITSGSKRVPASALSSASTSAVEFLPLKPLNDPMPLKALMPRESPPHEARGGDAPKVTRPEAEAEAEAWNGLDMCGELPSMEA